MRILSHRGFWRTPEERNTREAFARSLQAGFGVETDVRDLNGELVISHDPPSCKQMRLAEFLNQFETQLADGDFPLALNIKADGLQRMLAGLLIEARVDNYFVFDMSVPDLLTYLDMGIPALTRQSDIEKEPVCYDACVGVWFDALRSPWPMENAVERTLGDGKIACLVSPELHRRSHLPFWETVNEWRFVANPCLLLCTDFPAEANEFFTQPARTPTRGGG